MTRYGGVGQADIRRWMRTPLVAVVRLLGAAKRGREKAEGRGPLGPQAGGSTGPRLLTQDEIIAMLEGRLAERQRKAGGGKREENAEPRMNAD